MSLALPLLIGQARAGDPQACQELITLCLSKSKRMVSSFAQTSGLEAEELLQEVAFRLGVKWSLVLAAREPLPYAMRLARNTLIDRYRYAKAPCRRCVLQARPFDERLQRVLYGS